MKLEHKNAVVTGGARGIGGAVASRFSAAGAKVAILDRLYDVASQKAAELEAAGGQARPFEIDVTDSQSVRKAAEAVREWFGGAPDILANIAGVGFHRAFLDMTCEDFRRVINVNLTGIFLVSRAFADQMVAGDTEKTRVILNIGSMQGFLGGTGRAAYGTSRAGVHQLTRVMAVELANHNIRVNAVAAGPVQTTMINHGPRQAEAYKRRLLIKRYGTVEEIANTFLYLASDFSSYTTGAIFAVDGGMTAAGALYSYEELRTVRTGPAA